MPSFSQASSALKCTLNNQQRSFSYMHESFQQQTIMRFCILEGTRVTTLSNSFSCSLLQMMFSQQARKIYTFMHHLENNFFPSELDMWKCVSSFWEWNLFDVSASHVSDITQIPSSCLLLRKFGWISVFGIFEIVRMKLINCDCFYTEPRVYGELELDCEGLK